MHLWQRLAMPKQYSARGVKHGVVGSGCNRIRVVGMQRDFLRNAAGVMLFANGADARRSYRNAIFPHVAVEAVIQSPVVRWERQRLDVRARLYHRVVANVCEHGPVTRRRTAADE